MQVGVAYCATEVNFFLRIAFHFVRQCSAAAHFVCSLLHPSGSGNDLSLSHCRTVLHYV